MVFLAALSASAQPTAFTYQGFLTDNGAPANGSNDLTFTLYAAAGGGATVGVATTSCAAPASRAGCNGATAAGSAGL